MKFQFPYKCQIEFRFRIWSRIHREIVRSIFFSNNLLQSFFEIFKISWAGRMRIFDEKDDEKEKRKIIERNKINGERMTSAWIFWKRKYETERVSWNWNRNDTRLSDSDRHPPAFRYFPPIERSWKLKLKIISLMKLHASYKFNSSSRLNLIKEEIYI